MQLHAAIMPRSPLSLLSELLLRGPRNVRNHVRNKPQPLSVFSEETHGGVLRVQFLEHGEEERVWVGGERFRDVFLVEDIVEKCGELDHEEIRRTRGNQWVRGQLQCSLADTLDFMRRQRKGISMRPRNTFLLLSSTHHEERRGMGRTAP